MLHISLVPDVYDSTDGTWKKAHKWYRKYDVRHGNERLIAWCKDVKDFMMQMQYGPVLLHSEVVQFERDHSCLSRSDFLRTTQSGAVAFYIP